MNQVSATQLISEIRALNFERNSLIDGIKYTRGLKRISIENTLSDLEKIVSSKLKMINATVSKEEAAN